MQLHIVVPSDTGSLVHDYMGPWPFFFFSYLFQSLSPLYLSRFSRAGKQTERMLSNEPRGQHSSSDSSQRGVGFTSLESPAISPRLKFHKKLPSSWTPKDGPLTDGISHRLNPHRLDPSQAILLMPYPGCLFLSLHCPSASYSVPTVLHAQHIYLSTQGHLLHRTFPCDPTSLHKLWGSQWL